MGWAARKNPRAAEGKGRAAANRARLERFLTRVTTQGELDSLVRALADPSERQAVYDLLAPMCQLGANRPLDLPGTAILDEHGVVTLTDRETSN